MVKNIKIWEPVSITANWLKTDTSKLDDILPSWKRRRAELKEGDEDYEEFLKHLKEKYRKLYKRYCKLSYAAYNP